MNAEHIPIIGRGIYTIAEAARLARVPAARINRWICGYERDGVEYPPLWEPELRTSRHADLVFVSFADLMEARVIAAFYKHGVQIQTVRKAIEQAKNEFGIERPFATRKFQTDGKKIFLDIINEIQRSNPLDSRDKIYLDIISSQLQFSSIIKPALKDVEFENNLASRWWPLGKNKTVVVDPSRSLGKPINNATGVPVEALVGALDSTNKNPTESDFANVALLFEVSKRDVKEAFVFSEKFAA